MLLTVRAKSWDMFAGILTIGAEADVQTVAVSNQIRRHGWGRKLLAQLLNAAVQRKSTQVFLEVRADNHAAQQLYIDLGFVEIGRRTAYYQPDGVDAIVMRLTAPHCVKLPRSIARKLRRPHDEHAGSAWYRNELR